MPSISVAQNGGGGRRKASPRPCSHSIPFRKSVHQGYFQTRDSLYNKKMKRSQNLWRRENEREKKIEEKEKKKIVCTEVFIEQRLGLGLDFLAYRRCRSKLRIK